MRHPCAEVRRMTFPFLRAPAAKRPHIRLFMIGRNSAEAHGVVAYGHRWSSASEVTFVVFQFLKTAAPAMGSRSNPARSGPDAAVHRYRRYTYGACRRRRLTYGRYHTGLHAIRRHT